MNDAPEKLYYSISEVSDATGVKAHVLRYWESQFPMLRPRKSRGGMRMYRAKDAAIIQRIKYLLYDRGFTIAGARRKLFEDRRSGISYDAFEPDSREASFSIREETREAQRREEQQPEEDTAPTPQAGAVSMASDAGELAATPVAGEAAPELHAGPAGSGGASPQQLEFGSPSHESASAGSPGTTQVNTLQEIRAEIELLQAMLMAPPRLKIRT
jgi:DNA-binding transcriptional MerR regulator